MMTGPLKSFTKLRTVMPMASKASPLLPVCLGIYAALSSTRWVLAGWRAVLLNYIRRKFGGHD